MIRLYAGLNSKLLKVANYNVAAMVELVIIDCDDYEHIFPTVIYETREEECLKVIREISLWCEDDFDHALPTPLHEYALYSIFRIFNEIDQDYIKMGGGKSVLFKSTDNILENDIDKVEYNFNDLQDINFYMENYFLDHDFLNIPLYIKLAKEMRIKNFEKRFGMNFSSFESLMPPDIAEELFENYSEEVIREQEDNLVERMDIVTVVHNSMERFKHAIEQNGQYKLLWNDHGVPKEEKAVQMLFLALNYDYFFYRNIDISPETQSGRGIVDFKCSRGKEKVLIEVKLASHKKVLDGLSKQLVHYMDSEHIKDAVYLIVVFDEDEYIMIRELDTLVDEVNRVFGLKISVYIVDASRNKVSPSKL